MALRVAVNGFGRIGRLTARLLLQHEDIHLVAVNDLAPAATLVHLFKHDSIHGKISLPLELEKDILTAGNQKIKLLSEKDPADLPWKKLKADLVLESTGHFRTKDEMNKHIEAGAKQVVLSAPAKSPDVPTLVLGVNDHDIDLQSPYISNASCTTNCLAPMIKVLDENWGINKGFMTTTHAYTSDQQLHDAPHKDLRRARAAAQNIIPTSTGATSATAKIFPHLESRLQGMALRVPVIDGSLTEFICILNKQAGKEEINKEFKKAAENELNKIVEYSEEPLVSTDITGNSHSCIFDASLTSVMGEMVKTVAWYDNEFGYASRLADLIVKVAESRK